MVSDSPSGESRESGEKPPPRSYSEVFWEQFPAYLAMGMSSDEYWNGDSALTIAYRKAEKIKNDRLNEQLWLQGMYIYEALCDASPLFRSFGKKGAKAHEYAKEPYSLTKKDKEDRQERDERAIYEKGMARVEAFLKRTDPKAEAEVRKDAHDS